MCHGQYVAIVQCAMSEVCTLHGASVHCTIVGHVQSGVSLQCALSCKCAKCIFSDVLCLLYCVQIGASVHFLMCSLKYALCSVHCGASVSCEVCKVCN